MRIPDEKAADKEPTISDQTSTAVADRVSVRHESGNSSVRTSWAYIITINGAADGWSRRGGHETGSGHWEIDMTS